VAKSNAGRRLANHSKVMNFAAGAMKITAREFHSPRLQSPKEQAEELHSVPLPREKKQIGKIE
jgi:hypothetical protein